ncbi:MAG: EamA family transporter [Gemmatimonadetes bacterium]|nr:MAG: EamA family transporter [Gemmatimonadota bacterium]
MLWLIFALLTAVFNSLKDLFSKRSLLRDVHPYLAAWSHNVFALVLLIPTLWVDGIPNIHPPFWRAFVVSGFCNVLAIILYMKALHASDLSLAAPMITFTPLFLLLTAPLVVGEFPTRTGLMGVLLIVSGAYLLNRQPGRDIGAPLRAIVSDPGCRWMLLVAILFSISATFDKVGVQNSSPVFWSTSISILMGLAIFPLTFRTGSIRQLTQPYYLTLLIPIGVLSGLTLICQMSAIQLTLVAYVISIKRASVILSVLYGGLILGEKGLKQRLVGAVIMVAGVILITLSTQ